MGMPISSYTVLSALANGRNRYETEVAQRALSPFNLFAFVIHDPEEHSKFHQVLERQFDRFDFITGHKLLFLRLVDPPTNWLNHAKWQGLLQVVCR